MVHIYDVVVGIPCSYNSTISIRGCLEEVSSVRNTRLYIPDFYLSSVRVSRGQSSSDSTTFFESYVNKVSLASKEVIKTNIITKKDRVYKELNEEVTRDIFMSSNQRASIIGSSLMSYLKSANNNSANNNINYIEVDFSNIENGTIRYMLMCVIRWAFNELYHNSYTFLNNNMNSNAHTLDFWELAQLSHYRSKDQNITYLWFNTFTKILNREEIYSLSEKNHKRLGYYCKPSQIFGPETKFDPVFRQLARDYVGNTGSASEMYKRNAMILDRLSGIKPDNIGEIKKVLSISRNLVPDMNSFFMEELYADNSLFCDMRKRWFKKAVCEADDSDAVKRILYFVVSSPDIINDDSLKKEIAIVVKKFLEIFGGSKERANRYVSYNYGPSIDKEFKKLFNT